MKTSDTGIAMIKRFEGCRLKAYKCFNWETGYTIGYGHYNDKTIKKDTVITQAQADDFLKKDLAVFEKAVTNTGLKLKQNSFDALVSFAFNCGQGNLKNLTNGRDLNTIAQKIVLYNKSGGVVVSGLTKRRIEEQALILSDLKNDKAVESVKADSFYPIVSNKYNSIVDALKSIGVDSSFSNRRKIAEKNGITGYTGKASENMNLLLKLKNGTLRK